MTEITKEMAIKEMILVFHRNNVARFGEYLLNELLDMRLMMELFMKHTLKNLAHPN